MNQATFSPSDVESFDAQVMFSTLPIGSMFIHRIGVYVKDHVSGALLLCYTDGKPNPNRNDEGTTFPRDAEVFARPDSLPSEWPLIPEGTVVKVTHRRPHNPPYLAVIKRAERNNRVGPAYYSWVKLNIDLTVRTDANSENSAYDDGVTYHRIEVMPDHKVVTRVVPPVDYTLRPYSVDAGKMDGGEPNWKYCDSFVTLAEAIIAVESVRDYPLLRLIYTAPDGSHFDITTQPFVYGQ